jgi:hypothetical protein
VKGAQVPAILTDPAIPAEDLRQRLCGGDLVILTKLCALDKFVEYMRVELTGLLAPHDPEHEHEHIEPAEMAKILGVWKPRWIHAERSRELVRAINAEAGQTCSVSGGSGHDRRGGRDQRGGDLHDESHRVGV